MVGPAPARRSESGPSLVTRPTQPRSRTAMTHPDPRHVKRIFDEAAELPPDRRSEWLDRACGQDAGVRAQVQSLLDALEGAPEFLDSPTANGGHGPTSGAADPAPKVATVVTALS